MKSRFMTALITTVLLLFFAVPLGLKVNPQNLHGLATVTGGAVVRLQEDLTNKANRDEFVARLGAAVAAPVVKVKEFKFGDAIGEVFPTRLPPLRPDRTTLVMGKMAKPAAGDLTLAVNGSVAGRAVALNFAEKLPAPRIEHFFLNMMFDQWQSAPFTGTRRLPSHAMIAITWANEKLLHELDDNLGCGRQLWCRLGLI